MHQVFQTGKTLVAYANYNDTYFRDHISVNKYKFYNNIQHNKTKNIRVYIHKRNTQFMAQENNFNLSC